MHPTSLTGTPDSAHPRKYMALSPASPLRILLVEDPRTLAR